MGKTPLKNNCQLITYADSMGKNLKELDQMLTKHFDGCFGGIHILPFFPSSGDRGFAPISYEEVEPSFGTWQDVYALAEKYDLMADFIINHISRRSEYFEDYLRNGEDSKWADLFLRISKLAPNGDIPEEDLRKIYTRKPRAPFIEVELADGSKEQVWCTFSEEQIDINVDSEVGQEFTRNQLSKLVDRGIGFIRVDAFGYTIKRLGTSCFFVEPETTELLALLNQIVEPRGAELLPEIHSHYSVQLKLAEQGYWVYDFALPVLTLQALYDGASKNLKNWFAICPKKAFTTLDTHDGLPIPDVEDLMTEEETERTVENLFTKGANVQRRYSYDPEYKNLDVYQLNCTYFSALGDDDAAYLASRVIQFWGPGRPQVYHVGLLAGRNDVALMESTKFGRNINRKSYTVEEIEQDVQRDVVQKLVELLRFRNSYLAFDGSFTCEESAEDSLILSWKNEDYFTRASIDLKKHTFAIEYKDVESGKMQALSI